MEKSNTVLNSLKEEIDNPSIIHSFKGLPRRLKKDIDKVLEEKVNAASI